MPSPTPKRQLRGVEAVQLGVADPDSPILRTQEEFETSRPQLR